MLIVCPTCASTYRIELSALGPRGRPVRCARCQTVWFAAGTDAIAAAIDIEVDLPRQAADPASPPPRSALAENAAWREAAVPADIDDEATGGEATGAPSIVPGDDPPAEPHSERGSADSMRGADVETAAARRHNREAARQRLARRRKRGWPLAPLPTAIIAMTALIAILVAGRHAVVRTLPQTAWLFAAIGAPVNLRGLVFEDVKAVTETHDGIGVLSVEGRIVNPMRADMPAPRLRFSLRNSSGQEIQAWTSIPARDVIAAREILPFQSRLASPPAEARDLLVRFFHKRDAIAATVSGRSAEEGGQEARRGR